jgi:hypothetical protein
VTANGGHFSVSGSVGVSPDQTRTHWPIIGITGRSIAMMDVAMLALAVVFFGLSIGYVYACDRL